jgi:antitoxin component YwqK of YwqJK toxin-antitoxin module
MDREGASETICNGERLKRYEGVDFLSQQPYQKVLRVYNRNASGDIPAIVTSYHPNGQLKQSLEVVNGRAYGFYREWFPNGCPKVEAFVIGGTADITDAAEKSWLFDGCAQAWDESGNLQAEMIYVKGELHGVSTQYYASGAIWKKTPYEKNKIHGLYQVWKENGEILQTTEFAEGLPHGNSQIYWTLDRLAANEVFWEGKLINGSYWDKDNQLLSEIREGDGLRTLITGDSTKEQHQYRNGVLDGRVTVYNQHGQLCQMYHIHNGIKNGEEVVYYLGKSKFPRPKLSLFWKNAKIQGLVKTWYENGIQESQREVTNNAKHGLATAWYEDGSLMLLEEYDHDKLMRGEYYQKGEKVPVSLIAAGKGTSTLFDAEGNFMRKISYIEGVPVD